MLYCKAKKKIFVDALVEMKVLDELPAPDHALARPLGSIMEDPRWELVPLNHQQRKRPFLSNVR